MRVQPVAQPQVTAQRVGRGWVQRDQPGLAELGLADGQDAGVKAGVWPVEADCFADPHAGDREQPDQGLVGRCPQREPQPGGRCDEGGDVVTGIQAGSGPARPPRDQVHWRHLSRGVNGAQVGREASHC
jgi:hypothetical protein